MTGRLCFPTWNIRGGKFSKEDALSKGRKILWENTKWAIHQGFFGVPIFWLEGGEWFWGRDSIPHLKLALKGQDPLDGERYQRYLKIYEGSP